MLLTLLCFASVKLFITTPSIFRLVLPGRRLFNCLEYQSAYLSFPMVFVMENTHVVFALLILVLMLGLHHLNTHIPLSRHGSTTLTGKV